MVMKSILGGTHPGENIHFRVRIEKYPPLLIVATGVCFSVELTNSHAAIGTRP
jgi:hypothetical protein